MNVQAASRSPELGYSLSRAEKPELWVDQKIQSNEFPFAVRALFNAHNAGFTAGTTEAFNVDALPGETTAAVKLGTDAGVLPFPVWNFLGLLKEWENAFGRHGEIEANRGLMASLERDCLELDAQLKSWPEDDPGRLDRQTEIDGKRALCQQLSAIFPAEVYDKDDKTKCQDIDDTLDMLYAWSRKTPGGRKLLRVIAQGGPIQSKVAMHWLFDRQRMLSGVQQTEIRRIAESMPQRARSSKPFLKRLAERHSVWRTQLKDGIARYTMAEFDAAMKPKSAASHVPQEDMNQQVKTMRLVASTGSLATTNFSGSEEPDMHDRSDLLVPLSVSLLPLKERKLKMPQVDKTVPVDEDLLQVPVPLALE